jgi:hypothetical protein
MKKLHRLYLALVLAVTAALPFAPVAGLALVTGCRTTPERAAETTVRAANIAVAAAMDAYHVEVVRRERANESTRAADPGGYLDRRRELLLLDGKVATALGEYQAATKAAIHLWLAVKATGPHAPPEANATAEVTRALAELVKLTNLILKP